MRVIVAADSVFIPTWQNNKDEPEDDQIKVHYKFPTTTQRDRYITKYPVEMESKENIMRLKIETDDKAMFKMLVTKIENLEMEDESTGNVKKITTPQELLDARGLENLYDEIVNHLIGAQAVQPKN